MTWRRAILREAPAKELRGSLALVSIEAAFSTTTSTFVMVTPSGYRIEGLRVDHVAALLRELA